MQRRSMLLVALASPLLPGRAHAQALTEAHVKARVAFNLARFTQWPASAFSSPSAPHHWCVAVRDAALTQALAALRSEVVGGRSILPHVNPLALAGACQVLYVEGSSEPDATALLSEAAATAVLTIGDGDAFSQRGVIGLVNVNDSIRFDINLRRMRAAGLAISAQVLKLARRVHE